MTVLEAVVATKRKCIKEHLRGERHDWSISTCPMCRISKGCQECPLDVFRFDSALGCVELACYDDETRTTATPQDIACFLYSLELYLKR